jgi:hypothetical protein
MIEKPLLYAFLGGFLVAWAGQYKEFDSTRIAAFTGVIAAAGYLLKITMLVFGPAMGVLWLSIYWRGYRQDRAAGEGAGLFEFSRIRQGLVSAALMLLPLIAVAVSWTNYRVGSHCFASPIGHFFETAAGADQRWQAVFILVYMVALHSAYYNCFSPFGETGLQSFQRYFRPNMRLGHFFAPIIATFFLLQYLGRREKFIEWISSNRIKWLSLAAIAVLLVLQIGSLNRSLADTATRDQQSPFVRAAILEMKRDSDALVKLISAKGLSNPKVSIISQGGNDVAFNLGSYFGIKSKRNGEYFHYTPVRPFSWTPGAPRFGVNVTNRRRLAEWWRAVDIIWPVNTDDWIREVLSDVAADAECTARPEQFFLFRTSAGGFECIKKN